MKNRYDCKNCGGNLTYNVKGENLKCENCGNEEEIVSDLPIREHDYSDIKHSVNSTHGDVETAAQKETHTMSCNTCGATLELSDTETSTSCPYCDSPIVLAEKQEEAIVPDGIIPFKIDKNDASRRFTDWIKKRWLAPSQLKNLFQKGKVLGIYIPYWTFDSDVESRYSGRGGIDRTVQYRDSEGKTQTRIETDWYSVSGTVGQKFDDILVKATNVLDPGHLDSVGPFNTVMGLSGYSSDYMAGLSAERYNIPLKDAHSEAVRRMESEMRELASQDILRRYDRAEVNRINSRFYNETYKHVMLPVYSTSYSFKGKSYNVLINGEDGKIVGDYPKSYVKIGLIVALVVIILILVYTATGRSEALNLAMGYMSFLNF